MQPAVDPGAIGLLGEGGAVPQFGEPGDEAMGVAGKFGAGLVAEDNLLVGHEQHQQHGRVAGQRQPGPLACGVDDDIEVISAGAVDQATGPVPGGVPLVLLEQHQGSLAAGAVGHPGQPGHERRGLQA